MYYTPNLYSEHNTLVLEIMCVALIIIIVKENGLNTYFCVGPLGLRSKTNHTDSDPCSLKWSSLQALS